MFYIHNPVNRIIIAKIRILWVIYRLLIRDKLINVRLLSIFIEIFDLKTFFDGERLNHCTTMNNDERAKRKNNTEQVSNCSSDRDCLIMLEIMLVVWIYVNFLNLSLVIFTTFLMLFYFDE